MDVRKLFRSFRYAWNGISHVAAAEQNFRFHIMAALAVSGAGWITGLSTAEWVVLIILFGGMLSLEMLNTAIERVVDLMSPEHHPLAGQAKDAAAGAVLIFAAASILIGCMIFIPKWINFLL